MSESPILGRGLALLLDRRGDDRVNLLLSQGAMSYVAGTKARYRSGDGTIEGRRSSRPKGKVPEAGTC